MQVASEDFAITESTFRRRLGEAFFYWVRLLDLSCGLEKTNRRTSDAYDVSFPIRDPRSTSPIYSAEEPDGYLLYDVTRDDAHLLSGEVRSIISDERLKKGLSYT